MINLLTNHGYYAQLPHYPLHRSLALSLVDYVNSWQNDVPCLSYLMSALHYDHLGPQSFLFPHQLRQLDGGQPFETSLKSLLVTGDRYVNYQQSGQITNIRSEE